MNKRLFKNQVIGFIFISISGTIGHFIFKWSGKNPLIGLFFSVNESPWEHLKLLFFPFLAFTVYTAIKFKQDKFNIFFANCVSVYLGMWSILSYYYTFTSATGNASEFINVSSFFVGVAVSFIVSYFLINNSIGRGMPNAFGIIIFILTSFAFFLFTFKPPYIPLFQDPQTLTFSF
ncbi:MAG: hypothetical protein IJR70_01465 [Eubacterium sp.]|nr:hypothetical protein [Eubacterium sp.]